MKIGSLCSGYGGLELGVQAFYGGETAWVSDIDKGACKILAHRFPGIPNIGDMTTVDWTQVEPVDILTAGYPCQPFSHAGQRKGTNDARHLWPHVREAVRRIRPRITVLENVAGHRSLGFDRVLGDLAEDGMHVRWTSVRAADIGAPHGRERVFIGVTADADSGRRREHHQELGSVPKPDSNRPRPLLPTPTSRDWKDHTIRREPHRPGDTDTLARALTGIPCALLPTPVTPAPHDSNETAGRIRPMRGYGPELTTEGVLPTDGQWGKYDAAIARWEHVLGRPTPAPTMTSAKGNPQLSPAFVEWMMGLPAGWVTDVPGITRNEALKALGNGVVPAQAAAALEQMARWETP